MRRILINPLDDKMVVAFANGLALDAIAEDEARDKSLALEAAYRKLSIPKPPEEIIVVTGPGNFTAIRAGIGFARGLALGYNIASRGVDIFTLDYALIANAPQNAFLCRDARGGRHYLAHFENATLKEVKLVRDVAGAPYSAEALPFAHNSIRATSKERMAALAHLAELGRGKTPASAFYIRPPDAALPSEAPLVILDEE